MKIISKIFKNEQAEKINSFIKSKKRVYLNKKKPYSEKYPYSIHDPYLVSKEPLRYENFYLVGDNWLSQEPRDIVVVLGCNDWKLGFIAEYLNEYKVAFLPRKNTGIRAFISIKKLNQKPKAILIWGYNESKYLRKILQKFSYNIWRIEDGFIRSSDLGAAHSTPYSLVVDKKGLYYNNQSNSDLITLLNEYELALTPNLKDKTSRCLSMIEDFSLSKYNPPNLNKDRDLKIKKRVAILGQVDNDAAIKYGNPNGWTSKSLIELAYYENPECEILYRPHPEVYKGYQKSKLKCKSIEKIAEIISPEENIISFIDKCDHIYTITSLTGLEALIRGKKVTVVGTPFYAGWGPTDDRATIKRKRQLDINNLFYITYLVYPRYLKEENKYQGFLGSTYNIIADRELTLKRKISDRYFLEENNLNNILFSQSILKSKNEETPPLKVNEIILESLFNQYNNHLFHFILSCYLLGNSINSEPKIIDRTLTILKNSLESEIFLRVISLLYELHLNHENKEELRLIYYKHGLSYISRAIGHHEAVNLIRDISKTNTVHDVTRINNDNHVIANENKEEELCLPCESSSKELIHSLINEAIIQSIEYGSYDDAISLLSDSITSGSGNEATFYLIAKLFNERMDFDTASTFYQFIFDNFPTNQKTPSLVYELIRTSIYSSKSMTFDDVFKYIIILIKISPDKYLLSTKLFQLACSKYSLSNKSKEQHENIIKFTFNSLPESIELVSSLLDLREYYKAKNILMRLYERKTSPKKVAIYLSYYYTLTGSMGNAESILKNYINNSYDDLYLVREYLRVLRIAGKFQEGMSVIKIAKENGVNINPILEMPFLQGIGEIKKAYKTYTLIPFREKLINHFGNKYLSDYNNKSITGKVLMLAGWGPGDEIRFSALYPQFEKHFINASVSFSCDYRLYELLSETYPKLNFVATHRTRDFDFEKNPASLFSEIKNSDFSTLYDSNLFNKLPQYDHILLASDLIHLYMQRNNSGLSTVEYKAKTSKAYFNRHDDILYVGLNWRSSLDDKSRYVHYFDLQDFAPLLDDPKIKIISLQYDSLTNEERTWLERNHPGKIIEPEGIDQFNDLNSVASLITQLDCVIAPCTTVSELSGALGKKTFFISNSMEIEWRYQPDNSDIWFNSIEHITITTAVDKQSTLNKLFEKVALITTNNINENSNKTISAQAL